MAWHPKAHALRRLQETSQRGHLMKMADSVSQHITSGSGNLAGDGIELQDVHTSHKP